MPRARNIKPQIMANEDLAEIDALGRLLFVYLWMLADREGRLEDRPKRIKAQALPYDDADVDALLWELQEAGFILRYTVAEQAIIQIVAFAKHQNPHTREQDSELPGPGHEDAKHSLGSDKAQPRQCRAGLIPSSLIPDSPFLIPDSDSPSVHRGAKAKRFRPPTAEEVAAYCQERGNSVNPQKFIDHYTGNGWMRGKTKMKDWKAVIRTWEQNEDEKRTRTGSNGGSRARRVADTLDDIIRDGLPEERAERMGGGDLSEAAGGVRKSLDGEYRRH